MYNHQIISCYITGCFRAATYLTLSVAHDNFDVKQDKQNEYGNEYCLAYDSITKYVFLLRHFELIYDE